MNSDSMRKVLAIWEHQIVHWIRVSALINKSSPLLDSMDTWYLGTTRVNVSVSLVVAVVNTCIRSPAAAKMNLIVGSSGMTNVAEVECDWTWYGEYAIVNVRSLITVFESSASYELVSSLVVAAFRFLWFFSSLSSYCSFHPDWVMAQYFSPCVHPEKP